MKQVTSLVLLLFTAPLFAIDIDDCASSLTHLATLYELRSLMMKTYTTPYDVQRFADQRMEQLREPLPAGGYRWVRWVRPSGEGPVKKDAHTVRAVQGAGDADHFEASAKQVYAVRVAVPRKRSILRENNRAYVGVARITYTVDGRTRTREEPINQWMNPDTSRTVDLGTVADRVEVSVDVATSRNKVGESLVEVHFSQAVAQDDPANPAYSTIRMLERIRQSADPVTVDAEISAFERTHFPGSDPIPLLTLISDLRQADRLMQSQKPEDQEKGSKLLKETLRRLR